MSQLTSVTIFIILTLHCTAQGYGDGGSGNVSDGKNEVETRGNNHLGLEKERSARFLMNPFSIFNIVQFPNTACETTDMRHGTCYTSSECSAKGGTSMGRCSQGFGVCCLFEDDCDLTTTENGTYFVSPSNPRSMCKMTIRKLDDDICQVRLDFEELALSDPDANGLCDEDYIEVEPKRLNVPKLCGNLNNQHVIFSLSGEDPATLSVVLDDPTKDLMWRMKVTQISCDSPFRAPPGCLQYYTGVSGTVSSFNYKDKKNKNDPATGGLEEFPNHISNLNYNICLRQELGYCSVEWSTEKYERGLFSLSGSRRTTGAIAAADVEIGDTACDKDYVMIPQGGKEVSGMADLKRDRYCGQVLSHCLTAGCDTSTVAATLPQVPQVAVGAVSTSVIPFTLGVVTNGGEETMEFANRGFILKYKQKKCD